MANDTVVAISGWLGAEPRQFKNTVNTADGTVYHRPTTTMRVGVTPRNYNRISAQYEDGNTTWYSVRTYGSLAEHCAQSLQRGSPVLVRGRLISRQYLDKNDVSRNDMVIIADALGIELSTGRATFNKFLRTALVSVNGESRKDDEYSIDPDKDAEQESTEIMPEEDGVTGLDMAELNEESGANVVSENVVF